MKIKTRLTLLFTVLVASILLVFAGVIYWSSSQNREIEFYEELEKEAITKAKLFLEAKVKTNTLHRIYLNNSQIINEVEVAIYNSSFELLYHDDVEIDRVKETDEMLTSILKLNQLHFMQDDWQVIGMLYKYDGKDFIITATAFDEYGYTKLQNLFYTIIVLTIVSLLVIASLGTFFASRALMPIKKMISEVNKITATNLDLRLSNEQNKDELAALANTFNEMLNRLESSFDSQKQFVSNISHELRTPLAAIIAELDLALNKENEKEAYVQTIQNALADAKKLVKLSNSLLDFAKASYDPTEIVFKEVRIDEIILDACQKLQKSNSTYKFNFLIDESVEEEEMMIASVNPYLMEVALMNLLENACKYSDNHHGTVSLFNIRGRLVIKIADKGIGMSAEDIEKIFKPFYRGDNGKYLEGNGIGLSLTKKVVDLHKGTIAVTSQVNKGTEFVITL